MMAAIVADSGGGFILYISLIVVSTDDEVVHFCSSANHNIRCEAKFQTSYKTAIQKLNLLSGEEGPRDVVKPNLAIFFFRCPGST